MAIYSSLTNKANLIEIARTAGVAIPPSHVGPNPPSNFPLPAIVKPCNSSGFMKQMGVKALRVDSHIELSEYVNTILRAGFEPITQKFIPGGDDCLITYGASFFKGVPIAQFTGRKLIQYPPGIGDCAIGISESYYNVAKQAEKLLRHIGFEGIAQVEFKIDHQTKKSYLIEINPRAWSWNSLPTATGVNLPLALYVATQGKQLPLHLRSQQLERLRWRYGRLWLLATLRLLLEGKDWQSALRLGWGSAVNAVLAHGDWGPLRVYLPQIMRTLMGEFVLKARSFKPRIDGSTHAN